MRVNTLHLSRNKNILRSLILGIVLILTSAQVGVGQTTTTWDASGLGGYWITDVNWTSNIPTSTTDVVIPGSMGPAYIKDTTGNTQDLELNNILKVDSSMNLYISGDLNIQSDGNLTHNGNSIVINGNFTNNGTFANGPEDVFFEGSSNSQIDGDITFGHLTLDKTGSQMLTIVTSGDKSNVKIDSVFTITSGQLNINNHTLEIKGDLTNNSVASIGSGIVEFTGSTNSQIGGSTATEFDGLTLNKTNAADKLTLNSNITVTGDLTITTGELDLNGNTLTVQGDFENNGTITANGGTVEFTGSSNSNINGSNINFAGLTINKSSANVVLNSDISISGTATFTSGVIETNSYSVTFTDNATASGASANSYVNGPVTKVGDDDFTFPLGDNVSGTDYLGELTVNNSGGAISDEYTAHYYHQTASNYSDYDAANHTNMKQLSQVEYWDLNQDHGSSTPTVALHWDDGAESGITNPANLRVAHWNSSASGTDKWENLSNTGTTGSGGTGNSGSVISGSVSNFSPFTFGSTGDATDNPLPIELLSFHAQCLNNSQARVSWTTATERNNDYFEIQVSEDGQQYQTVETIQGAGNSNEQLSYESLIQKDNAAYVRLKQTDFDGQSEMFDPTELNCQSAMDKVNLYPNPVQNNLNIDFSTLPGSEVNVTVFTPQGKQVYQTKRSPETSRMQLKLNELPQGVYFVRIITNEQQVVKKITK